jgi:hypothetical protein
MEGLFLSCHEIPYILLYLRTIPNNYNSVIKVNVARKIQQVVQATDKLLNSSLFLNKKAAIVGSWQKRLINKHLTS